MKSVFVKQSKKSLIQLRECIRLNVSFEFEHTVTAVKEIRALELKDVESPFPPNRQSGEQIDFSFERRAPPLISELLPIRRQALEPEKPKLQIGESNPCPLQPPTQSYLIANFNLPPDEAEIVEVDVQRHFGFARLRARPSMARNLPPMRLKG